MYHASIRLTFEGSKKSFYVGDSLSPSLSEHFLQTTKCITTLV